MILKRTIIALFCLLTTTFVHAQIGIGTSTPDESSVLDVSSTDKGVLAPRLTSAQRDGISSPAKGLIIYNITEECIQVNIGTSSSPNWHCVGSTSSASVINNCNANGFEGEYLAGQAFTATNTFTVTITNNSFIAANISFATSDLVLSGVSGLTVNSVTPTSSTLAPGASVVVEYGLSGTPTSTDILTGTWTKLGLNCTKTVEIVGNATFSLPESVMIISIHDGTPLIDVQGVVDNGTNQIVLQIPYTSGIGDYEAFTGNFTLNNSNTGEGGDVNSFRVSYPAGTFSASGNITATIEVDGDGSFNAEKQLFGASEALVALDFQINGISKGNIELDIFGGIPDRKFADVNYKYIYIPVTAADGNTWLNNNLGANYANINHPQFSPLQQATAFNDVNAYGSLYQWGRYSDGHEQVNYTSATSGTMVNGTTTTQSSSDTPGHNLVILTSANPDDWRSPKNDNLWQGESGVNNPCPLGYRLPTDTELINLTTAEGITNNVSAASSSLAFSSGGLKLMSNGVIVSTGSFGFYPSSTTFGDFIKFMSIGNTLSTGGTYFRSAGMSVRCIKD